MRLQGKLTKWYPVKDSQQALWNHRKALVIGWMMLTGINTVSNFLIGLVNPVHGSSHSVSTWPTFLSQFKNNFSVCLLLANKPWYFKAPEKRKFSDDQSSASKQKYYLHHQSITAKYYFVFITDQLHTCIAVDKLLLWMRVQWRPVCCRQCVFISRHCWVMRCWRGYLSGARCRLFAYGPAYATASQKPVISCLI